MCSVYRQYGAEHVLDGPYLYDHYDISKTKEYLSMLTPDNMFIYLTSKEFESAADKTEKWCVCGFLCISSFYYLYWMAKWYVQNVFFAFPLSLVSVLAVCFRSSTNTTILTDDSHRQDAHLLDVETRPSSGVFVGIESGLSLFISLFFYISYLSVICSA